MSGGSSTVEKGGPAKSAGLIPFPNHLCLGAKPQAVQTHDKAK